MKRIKNGSYGTDVATSSPKEIVSQGEAHKPHVSHSSFELPRQTFVNFLETRPPDVCANIMICLIHQCNFLLDRQIKKLENDFVEQDGLREIMFNARLNYRQNRS